MQKARIVLALVLALPASLLAVDVKVDFDKTFDFRSIRTWNWAPDFGQVIMARHKDDDPEAMRDRAEPIIVNAVAAEMTKLGLPRVDTVPDMTVMYYLLLSTNFNAQTVGQFLPSTVQWGLPLFAPQTSSLEYMNQGSLVIDLRAKDVIVWRGLAQAKIKPDETAARREQLLRESIRDLLKRFPKRQ